MMLLPFFHHRHYNSAMDKNLVSLPSSFNSLTLSSSSPSSMTDFLLHPFSGIHTHSTPISLSTPRICNNCSIYSPQPLGLQEVQHPCAFLSNPGKALQFKSLRAYCCRCRGMSSCSPSPTGKFKSALIADCSCAQPDLPSLHTLNASSSILPPSCGYLLITQDVPCLYSCICGLRPSYSLTAAPAVHPLAPPALLLFICLKLLLFCNL